MPGSRGSEEAAKNGTLNTATRQLNLSLILYAVLKLNQFYPGTETCEPLGASCAVLLAIYGTFFVSGA